MIDKYDMIGKKFGKLLVLEYVEQKGKNHIWKCQCDCGNIICVSKSHLGRNTNSCGCLRSTKNKEKMIGKKFGKLLVLNHAGTNGHNSIWECQCECGKITYVLACNLKKSKSCGCLWRVRGEKNCRWTGYKDISGRFWLAIQNNAKTRHLDLTITIEYIWNLLIQQNKKCAVSGLDIDVINGGCNRNGCFCTASLDRIDNSKGYVVGNVRWVHKLINRMKMDLPENLFLGLCSLINKNKKHSLSAKEISELNTIIIRRKKEKY